MDIKLYRNNSLSNVVNKNLTLVTTSSNAKFLEPYDEYSPVIRYRGKTNFDDVNYIGIEQSGSGGFVRYYFIENVTYKSPAIAIITCRLDVLKTYSTFIGSLKCYITRTSDSTLNKQYLMDNRPTFPNSNVEKLTFRDINDNVEGFVVPGESKDHQRNNGMYILTTLQAGYDDATPWPENYTPE